MESTRHPLPPELARFLVDMKNYIELPLYFYGSIQRSDFFPGESDIDIAVFSENVPSTLAQLLHFLKLAKRRAKQFVTRFANTTHVAYGYKIVYTVTLSGNSYPIEIAVYSKNDETAVRSDQNKKASMSAPMMWLLIILKYLYYKLQIIPSTTFNYIKTQIIDNSIVNGRNDFVKISY